MVQREVQTVTETEHESARARRAAYFVSDSTGITAETLGSALLANFPSIEFDRHTIPFVDTRAAARSVVAEMVLAGVMADGPPLVFTTLKHAELREIIAGADAVIIDLLAGHLRELEDAVGATASEQFGQLHSVGDMHRYLDRMRAVEYAIEHDDGQSTVSLEKADVIVIAPSRCGKTPISMYLALRHGLLVANYPLTDDDFPAEALPRAIAEHAHRCFGLTTTALRLGQVRAQRRPDSRYASLQQCALELRRAEALYRRNGIPFLNSATKSVEEMSATIMRTLKLRASSNDERWNR